MILVCSKWWYWSVIGDFGLIIWFWNRFDCVTFQTAGNTPDLTHLLNKMDRGSHSDLAHACKTLELRLSQPIASSHLLVLTSSEASNQLNLDHIKCMVFSSSFFYCWTSSSPPCTATLSQYPLDYISCVSRFQTTHKPFSFEPMYLSFVKVLLDTCSFQSWWPNLSAGTQSGFTFVEKTEVRLQSLSNFFTRMFKLKYHKLSVLGSKISVQNVSIFAFVPRDWSHFWH